MSHRFNARLSIGAVTAIAVFLSAGAMLAMACGAESEGVEADATPVATAPPNVTEEIQNPGDESPPDLTVTAGDTSITAGLGTFCYDGLCADAFAMVTPVEPLAAEGATTLHGELAFETIEEISISAHPVSTFRDSLCVGATPGPTCGGENARLAWGAMGGEGESIAATIDGAEFNADISSLAPDSYVVSFFVRYTSGGDGSYGVLLQVA